MSASFFMLKMLKRKHVKKTKPENTSLTSGNNPEKCRICLKEGNIPIYEAKLSFDLPEAIRTFGDVEICESDTFPKYLCKPCQLLLTGAILFRKCAKESDEILRTVPVFSAPDPESVSNHSDDLVNQDTAPTDKNRYSCKQCKVSFKTIHEITLHRSTKQHKNVRIQCQVCYRLLSPQLYNKHMVCHQSTSHLVCEVCGKLFRKDNLFRHLQLHNYELPFQCQVCPYRGRFLESLKIHMRTHTGEKPFSCGECELKFITRSNLNRHLLSHKKDRPYKCYECGRGFYTQHDVDIHFKSDHAGIKDFNCSVCGNKYGTKKALMRHELRVHRRTKMSKGRRPLYLQEEFRKD